MEDQQLYRKKGTFLLWELTLFLLLIPVFFTLHFYNHLYYQVTQTGALLVLGFAIVLGLLSWLLIRIGIGKNKNVFFPVLIIEMGLLFWQYIVDQIKSLLPEVIAREWLIFTLGILMVIFILRKNRKRKAFSLPVHKFFILLFSVLITTEIALFINHSEISEKTKTPKTVSLNYNKVHLIVLDEYPSPKSLYQNGIYSSDSFFSNLRHLGFKVYSEGISNYNFTEFSMASFLNQEYLDFVYPGKKLTTNDYLRVRKKIFNSRLVADLEAAGYSFYNNSIFKIKDHTAFTDYDLYLNNAKLIFDQTLPGKYIITPFVKALTQGDGYSYSVIRRTERQLSQLDRFLDTAGSKPQFIYTHILTPHAPFAYNSNGYMVLGLSEDSLDKRKNRLNFSNSLIHCNQSVLPLIKKILNSDPGTMVILMGDHGLRELNDVSLFYPFSAFKAVYIPTGKYDDFPEKSSHINFSKEITGHLISDKVSYIKDSSISLY